MARVKRGVTAHKRHKRLLNAAEGRRGTRSRLIKPAREALINAAARQNGLTYSALISGLKQAGVVLDRKVLADIAVRDAATFASIAEVARAR